MIHLLVVAGWLAQTPVTPESAEALVGKVRVTGPAIGRTVMLVVDGKPIAITGDVVAEIARLASAKLEVVGARDGERFAATEYRILDVGGGAKPLVGQLIKVGVEGLALQDGDGDPIPLTMSARSKARLLKKVGSKVWIFGKKLVSGELKVKRHGILREPPKN